MNQPADTCNNNFATYRTFIDVRMGNKGAAPGTGPRFLIRLIGMGFTHNAHHFHGFVFTQVGEDAEPLPLWQHHPQQTLNVASGKTYDLITTVDFPGGADNLRYDAATKRVYVACGDEKTGAIATVDAMTNKRR